MTSERKPIIKSADMSDDMQQDAVECASVVRHIPTNSPCHWDGECHRHLDMNLHLRL